jgi:clathrin heavy chain
VDEQNIIPYITNTLKNFQLAIDLASRCGLPGAEDLFDKQFQQLFAVGDFQGAARVAAESPSGVLRNINTIQRYQQLPTQPGQTPPLLMYFGILLEKGKLNKIETLELARVVLTQGRLELIQKWVEADKLDCCEELGDIVRQFDLKTAMQIYYRGNVSHKVVVLFAETGQYDKVLQYCQKSSFTPDWSSLVQSIIMTQPAKAVEFAKNLVASPGGPLISVEALVDIFMSRNLLQETTSLLLDVLKDNKPEQAALQTRLIELNIMGAPQVADAILNPAQPMFTHYDRPHIARLCEQVGLFRRALEHLSDVNDVKRVLAKYIQQGKVELEFLIPYFGILSAEDGLDALRSLLKLRQNVKFVGLLNGKQLSVAQLVAQIATEYSKPMTASALIQLFEQEQCPDGMYFFLGQAVNFSDDPLLHNNYIMAAVRVGDMAAVENTVSKSSAYEPALIREFLMNSKLTEKQQGPLITVCDRFGFIDEMTKFFYKRNMMPNIEIYVQQINGMNTPKVAGTLLDLQCNEDYIKRLVVSARNTCPVAQLVEEVEKRNRLKLILDWLEARVAEGKILFFSL